MGASTMRCFPEHLVAATILAAGTAMAQTSTYNVGRTPTAEEVRAWDISIGPAGKELPAGSGTAKDGAKLFAQKCAACHGPTGVEGPATVLAGGKGTLTSLSPKRSIGSYWPYATTLWDYINRGMPFNSPGTLSANEVYALTAFLLFRNEIVKESDMIDAKSLPQIHMPNREAFYPSPVPQWKPGEKRQSGVYP
jgi:S-disulfanyl-L-cysteine oxidoreductase SoxD